MTSTNTTTDPGTGTLLEGVDPAPLFTPFGAGELTLSNRFVMAPMTRGFSPNGVPGADVRDYYARRASHLGLIVTEGTYVDHPSAGSSDRIPTFYGDEALAGWKSVVDAVHAEGGRIFPQLWHLGVTRSAGAAPHPDAPVISPSGVRSDGSPKGEAASTKDIDDIIAAFVQGALDAQRIGFDGIELHGAHGYLLDQFLWAATNRRGDRFGGSTGNRTQLAAEVVAAIRSEVGPEYPIDFRFSQWKGNAYDARIASTPQELEQILTPLVDAGVSILHASTRRYWLPEFDGSSRTLAGWTKHLTGLPTIALGSVGVSAPFLGGTDEAQPTLSIAPLLELFEQGEFDLVALGRSVLADPEFTEKLRTGRAGEIRAYQKDDESTLY
ncbi:12-oxophytodienoate reductase [Subtercola boreus]|uniref:12-oxophytodienoate reductase n=1 Tax=Subtercola boreus TaxID=120213 RepID=A0A3E0VLA1_9MICO|nr:NADH:flavin oxidoreductase [Subtercola boreus]RFA10213.1 12-oxophytodienoate reductase [Subtercola boreus]TQL52615.1 2,4-dienoyl-CoA reductase-like NADH-dependent reductase (Old Yellow Enzyme family) [Subtercola boreus]